MNITSGQYNYPSPLSPTKFIAPSAGPPIYTGPNPNPGIYNGPARPLPFNAQSESPKPFFDTQKLVSPTIVSTTPIPTQSGYPKIYESPNSKYPLSNDGDDIETAALLKQQNPISSFVSSNDNAFNTGALSPIPRNENFIQGQRFISPNTNNINNNGGN